MVNVARAVEEDIERRQLACELRDRRVVQHVEDPRRNVVNAREFAEQLRIDVGREDLRAFACHGHRRGMADPLSRRGDQCGLALQPSGHDARPFPVRLLRGASASNVSRGVTDSVGSAQS